LKGTIQKYFSNRGFGFIEIDGKEDNVFFHRSNYPVNEIPAIGQDVEFTIVDTPKGNEAKYRELLKAAKVNTIKDIAGYEPDALLEKLLAVNQEENITKRPPTLAKVEDWVKKAKNTE
jgi:cold shock CspA family protein